MRKSWNTSRHTLCASCVQAGAQKRRSCRLNRQSSARRGCPASLGYAGECHRLAARLGSGDPLAGDARPDRRVRRKCCARAIARRRRGLGSAPPRPSRSGWPLGRRGVRAACLDLHEGYASAVAGSRCGPEERSDAQGDRPGARPLHLGRGVRQCAVLRRRSRALYQRTGTCHRCVFRRGQRSSRREAASRAVERWRLELRRPAQSAVVIPHDDLRARGIAGVRDRERSDP